MGETKSAKADDFQLTAEDKRNLSPRAIGRFHELHKHAKAVESRVEELSQVNTQLSQARESIIGVLKQTHTTEDDLAHLLDFNYQFKSGNVDAALEWLDSRRAVLLKQAGREAPGYDPLAEHQDLQQQVEDGDMSRAAALEVVKARSLAARHEAQDRAAREQQEREQAYHQEREQGLEDIAKWNRKMHADDPQFSQKADILAGRMKDIVTRFQPKDWVAAIQMAYDTIQIPAGTRQPTAPKNDGGLRPRGGMRPGPAAPGSMLEAISRGLGSTQ